MQKSFLSISLFLLLTSAIGCSDRNTAPQSETVENATLRTILNRKSVRQFTNREIEPVIIDKLLRAAMAAPSSRDRRPWHFIVLTNKELLKSLGEQLPTASALKNANKAILVCGDIQISDNCWFLDCSAATQNILLAAEALGLGAVWTAVYPYEDRAAIVNTNLVLPENIKILSIIPLGYPSGNSTPKDKFDQDRIHFGKW